MLKLLSSDHYQLGILSYIGASSYDLRSKSVGAIRDLNRYLADRGCAKQVGLRICDRPTDKSSLVKRSRAVAFVDDKLATCRQAAEENPSVDIFFVAENRPRDRSVWHVRSFSDFISCVVESRHIPVEDIPLWQREFPIP